MLLRGALDRRAGRSGCRFFQILLPIIVQRGTHLNPYRPTKAIVTDGVYGLSRNPIYVAFLLIVLSFVPFTNSLWFIGSAILTVLLLQFGVVTREEKYLHEKFGAEYDEYCQRVRRWI